MQVICTGGAGSKTGVVELIRESSPCSNALVGRLAEVVRICSPHVRSAAFESNLKKVVSVEMRDAALKVYHDLELLKQLQGELLQGIFKCTVWVMRISVLSVTKLDELQHDEAAQTPNSHGLESLWKAVIDGPIAELQAPGMLSKNLRSEVAEMLASLNEGTRRKRDRLKRLADSNNHANDAAKPHEAVPDTMTAAEAIRHVNLDAPSESQRSADPESVPILLKPGDLKTAADVIEKVRECTARIAQVQSTLQVGRLHEATLKRDVLRAKDLVGGILQLRKAADEWSIVFAQLVHFSRRESDVSEPDVADLFYGGLTIVKLTELIRSRLADSGSELTAKYLDESVRDVLHKLHLLPSQLGVVDELARFKKSNALEKDDFQLPNSLTELTVSPSASNRAAKVSAAAAAATAAAAANAAEEKAKAAAAAQKAADEAAKKAEAEKRQVAEQQRQLQLQRVSPLLPPSSLPPGRPRRSMARIDRADVMYYYWRVGL